MTNNYQIIEEELLKTKTATTKEEISNLCFLLSKEKNIKDIEEISNFIYKKRLYIRAIDYIFSNKVFVSIIDKILKNKNNKEDLLFLYSGLNVIGFLISLVFDKLTKDDALFVRRILSISISRLAKEFKVESIPYLLEKIIREEYPRYKYPVTIVEDFYYKNRNIASSIMGIVIILIPRIRALKKSLKSHEKTHILKTINSIYSNIYKTKKSIENYSKCDVNFNNFIENILNKNEKNTFFIIEKIIENLHHIEGRSFHGTIIEKIKNAKEDIKIIDEYATKNFAAFSEDILTDDSEWSNKIYLISKKTLSVLDSINIAKDENWKVKVAIHELGIWISEVHKIINKFEIEDDWEQIKDYINQENNLIEWKSTFYTPTEQIFFNEEREKIIEKNIIDSTADAILSMINTDGGNILVGLVENPEKIKRENIKKNTIIKNGVTFFNVDYEFNLKNRSVDSAKRDLLEILYNKTGQTSEKYNQLFSIKKFIIKDSEHKVSNIYLIEVKKANTPIFSQEKKGEGLWISILKRANGKTVYADPKDYCKISN